jgi:hypothetical protein
MNLAEYIGCGLLSGVSEILGHPGMEIEVFKF